MTKSTLSNDQVTFVDYEDSNLSLFHKEHFPVILLKQNGMNMSFRLTIQLFILCGSEKRGKKPNKFLLLLKHTKICICKECYHGNT